MLLGQLHKQTTILAYNDDSYPQNTGIEINGCNIGFTSSKSESDPTKHDQKYALLMYIILCHRLLLENEH
jgi:hypothetical protein